MNWATTFTRFPPGRTPLGPVAVRVEDWSRPQPGRAPMFDQPLLERLSCARPSFPLAVYLPVGIWLAWRAAQGGLGGGAIGSAYVAGLLAGSVLE